MLAKELRRKYIDFFVERNHVEIPGAPLIPENDPSVLFTTAGMHPLIPFLMGEKHPAGKRLVDCQKSLRTDDIDEVGDTIHLTFFEMLGNWSLGDYFKEEAIKMSYEFLTKVLGLPQEKLFITVFGGDETAPKDDEAFSVWRSLDISEDRIYFLGKKYNWWGLPVGGPCGPDTEMFYDTGRKQCSPECNPACSCGKYWEIWNDVFMQYNKTPDGKYLPLSQKNVDTGFGLERATALLQNKETVYETELFKPIMDRVKEISQEKNIFSERVITEHIRAATFLLAEGIAPANLDESYILRRLIRRVIRHGMKLGIKRAFTAELGEIVIDLYKDVYPEVLKSKEHIIFYLKDEEEKFGKTLERGEKEFLKVIEHARENKVLQGKTVFRLYDTYGFPPELTKELCDERGFTCDMEGFQKQFKKHQELSRAGADKKFAGGLADHEEMTTKLHTATHLMHEALRRVLGKHVQQKGSNITVERLRFDFTHPDKMTPEEIKKVEDSVNEVIHKDLPVKYKEMTKEEADNLGALAFFAEKYGDRVKVYTIGDYSKEVCGGPHVERTGLLGKFKIIKEQSSSAGVRRIKAVLN
ncbi:MAG TPA: alanine--tRNA ligase [Candidatus Eremiobacteraeota bacterium]|nr:MAG: Alanine--tRNA ligase [bacterium ADurb.Bin363]HPZ08389.1 alanine--tRNA ligase [Candidatus Eremiobacteraeota bacterium]